MIAVIGDIHGCYNTLVELYGRIKERYGDIPVYSVGDLIDRGRFSYEVVNFIIDKKIYFTPGNHDYMMYHFFKESQSVFAHSWVFNGSESTLESYEKVETAIFNHIEVIRKAPLYFNLNDCFICHAGVSSYYKKVLPHDFKNDLDSLYTIIYGDYSSDHGVLWTRDSLLNLGKLQVVGHTKHQEITYVDEANAVYIDTGACVGNKLSAIIVHENEIVDTFDQKTNINDII